MTEFIRSLAAGQRPRPRALLAPLVALAVLVAVGFAVGAAARSDLASEGRTVVLVARDMTFYVEGSPVPNPRLVVARGETLRLVLRNDDPGMAHDLLLPTLERRSQMLRDAGTSTELVVRAPELAGEHPYLCSLHSLTMVGVLDVR